VAGEDRADKDAVAALGIEAIVPAVLIGLLGGSLVGMTGIGAGSVIAALLLVFYPDTPPHVIVGSATLQAAMMKLAGVWARRQFHLRERGLGVTLAVAAIPCAVAGAHTSSHIDATMLRPIISAALVLVGLLLVIQAVRRRDRREDIAAAENAPIAEGDDGAAAELEAFPRVRVLGIGASVGYLAGLTSIGTGTLFVSAMAGPLRIEAHRAVAAALVAGLLTLVVSAGVHALLGNIDPALAVVTALGSVPGVIFGTALGRRMPAGALRGVIGVGILIAVGISVSRLG
jgi:uncharacterized membrane protein YfcA